LSPSAKRRPPKREPRARKRAKTSEQGQSPLIKEIAADDVPDCSDLEGAEDATSQQQPPSGRRQRNGRGSGERRPQEDDGSGDRDDDDGCSHDVEELRRQTDELHRQLAEERARREDLERTWSSRLESSATALRRALVAAAKVERDELRAQVVRDSTRLGYWRAGMGSDYGGSWEGGTLEEEIKGERRRLDNDKQSLDRERRKLAQMRRRAKNAAATTDGDADDAEEGDDAADNGEQLDEEVFELRELLALRSSFLANAERCLRESEQKLAADRLLHLRRLKIVRALDNSQLRAYPVIKNRYQILNLVGRGGFSEVYKAYDTVDGMFCGVKIHTVTRDMGDEQRESYIRHAIRESEIHKQLLHPRIVRMYHRFCIDANTFATVLEYCEGVDLDTFLKRNGPLSEKETRGIEIQILSALKHLNKDHKIIHYDLKPANLMFRKGEIKILDFGLSKQVDRAGADTMELTSQGAGTYWYLPPECLMSSNGAPARISNKVDVWSVGVIGYECVFGKRPFGHGMAQDHFLGAVSSLHFQLEFPQLPKSVTSEFKDFLRALLNPIVEQRPDVLEAYNHPYIRRR